MFPSKVTGLMALLALLGSASPAASAPKPVTVWEDKAGDTEFNATPTPGLDQGGLDLVSGSIARNKTNLEFTVTHSAMPPIGTMPETFRFLWAFSVDGTAYRLTVKSADIGKPDAVAGTGTDRVGKLDTAGHFRLEGECTSNPAPAAVNFINCKQLAYLEGAFDPAAKSFTVSVPMEVVKAKTGSVIGGAGGNEGTICMICWVSHLAERSHQYTIIDPAIMASTYKVPK